MATEEQFEQLFREADTDEDGYLSLEELVVVLKKNDYAGSDDQILTFFETVDRSQDGMISFDEFMEAMGAAPKKFHTHAVVRRIFHEFDQDGNGVISRDELAAVFAELGRYMADEEVEELMAAVDQDSTGTIDYEEFASGLFGL